MGTATFRVQGHPGGDGGEGDSTGGPKLERQGLNDWPTLVIEAGDSESLDQLRLDMEWWFRESNHEVKIILLAKFDHNQHEIRLEKWEEELQMRARPGATTTRSVAAMTAAGGEMTTVHRQTIVITQDATTNPPSYNVARGALVLSFRLLFLRTPRPGEGDFVFSIPDLQEYAASVWGYVRD